MTYFLRIFETPSSTPRSITLTATTEMRARIEAERHLPDISVNGGHVEVRHDSEPFALGTLHRTPGGSEWRE